jgi:hypothetical protein
MRGRDRRLLDDNPPVLVQPHSLEAADDVVEQHRRDRQEEEWPLDSCRPHPLGEAVEGRRVAIVPGHVREVPAEIVEDLLVDRLDALGDALPRAGAHVVVAPL